MRQLRILLLTLGDSEYEQQRLEAAVGDLNRAFAGSLRLQVQPWTGGFYPHDAAFQAQLRTVECNLIIAIFRVRDEIELPAEPERMSDGSLYPANSPYEVLAALAERRGGSLPPIHVFRHPRPNLIEPAPPDRPFELTFHDFASTDDFERQLRRILPQPTAAAGAAAGTLPASAPAARLAAAFFNWFARSERNFRLTAIAAAAAVVLAVIAAGVATSAHRRMQRAEAHLADANRRVADAEHRGEDAEHRLATLRGDVEAAAQRVALTDELVTTMTYEFLQTLRSADGVSPETTRQVLQHIDDAVGPLFDKAKTDPDIVIGHASMLAQFAQTDIATGDAADGRKTAERAVALLRPLNDGNSPSSEVQRAFEVSLKLVGNAASRQGDAAGAVAAYEEALAVSRRLAASEPTQMRWQREVMAALLGLGDAENRGGDAKAALANYEGALTVMRKLADAEPNNMELLRGETVIISKVGDAKDRLADGDGALTAFEEGLALQRKIAAAAPDDSERQRYVAIILGRIGDLQDAKGNKDTAAAAYDESLTIRRTLATQNLHDRQAQIDLAVGLFKSAQVAAAQPRRKDLQDALVVLQKLDRETKLTDEPAQLADAIRKALAQGH
jgi:tetratricopeptide (TPR) repeat protein